MTRTPTKQTQSGDLVSGAVVARWLGITDHTVREMAKAGIVVRAGRGVYRLEESVRRAFEHTRQTASQRGGADSLEAMRAERIRIARAQADALESKNAELSGKTFTAEAIEREWTDILRTVRAGMLAVPSRCAGRLPHLSRSDISEIDREVRAVLTEVGNGTK